MNHFRKGHEDHTAWLGHEAPKIADDPDVNPDMMIAENVANWVSDPKVPDACRRLGAEHKYSRQVIRILTSHYGTPNIRRRILVISEPMILERPRALRLRMFLWRSLDISILWTRFLSAYG